MREGQFIRQNETKWKGIEQSIKQPQVHPDVLAGHFIELTDDLAYAKTFYPDGESVKFLNNLARLYHQKIYANKKEDKTRFYWFWQFDLPMLFYRYRKIFLYSFCFFLFFLLLGIISAKYDEGFVRLIMGDAYVNMTIANIEKGNPFGVYQSAGQLEMFFAIAINNIRVAFLSYVSGIVLGVGPVFMNMQNSIMLGAFEYFFFSRNLGWDSISVIFIHGTLEIWSIVIAIASGMILANGLLFPGTYSRGEALRRSGLDGMKIVFGLTPLFLLAAFLESFVTRYANMPMPFKLAILGGSLAFLIWYFIIYPYRLHKKVQGATDNPSYINYKPNQFQQWLQQRSASVA
ncbi:MAG: stage II sporulation protein M [Niabella sp.]